MATHYGKADFITYGKPSLFLDFANKKSLTDRISGNNLITFTRTSTGTYVGSDGLIKSAAANEARFDHNPVTGESLGLLMEEQRTNRFLNSEDFNNATWNKISVTATIASSATLKNSGVFLLSATGTSPRAVPNTRIGNASFSYYVKKVSGSLVSVTISPGTEGGWGHIFNFDTGSYSFIRGGHRGWSANAIYIGDGWWRLWGYTSITNIFGDELGIGPGDFRPGSGDQSGASILVVAPQLEAGSFPTSYIPTAGSQVTRTADTASITGTNFSSWYSQNAGTFCSITTMNVTTNQGLYINSARTIYELAPNVSFTGIENSTLTSRGWTMRSIPPTSPGYEIFDNYSKTGTHKMASYFSSSGVGFSVDSRSIVSASVSNPTSLNSSAIYIGNAPDGFGTYGHLNGTISRLVYYPTRLPDAQLQALTR